MPRLLAFDRMNRFSFRDVWMPVTKREQSLAHEIVNHGPQYSRGQLVETPTIGNRRFTYTVPASDAVDKLGYTYLFTVELRRMWEAMRDRTPGPLVDPFVGEVRVKPISIADDLDPTRDRQGATLTLVFEEAPTLAEIEGESNEDQSIDWAINESIVLDTEFATLDWNQRVPEQLTSREIEWTQETPPEPSVNPIDALTGVLRQVDRAANKPRAILEDAAFRLEKLDKAFNDLRDPKKTAALAASARRLNLGVMRLLTQQRAGQRPLTAKKTPWDMTALGVVSWLGGTFDEFLKLNPRLARSPQIRQGTIVLTYK